MRTQSARAKGTIIDTIESAPAKHPALDYRTLNRNAIAPIRYYHLMNPKQ